MRQELFKAVAEAYGIETKKSDLDGDKPRKGDLSKVQKILDNPNLPAKAEDGKAYVIRWADGRAVFAVRTKKDIADWLKKTGSCAEIVSIKYGEPEVSGKKIRVSESLDYPGKELGDRISKIQQVPARLIHPTEKTDPKQVEQIKQALAKGEQVPPIIVEFGPDAEDGSDTLHIVDGHHRFAAMLAMGQKIIPVRTLIRHGDEGSLKVVVRENEDYRGQHTAPTKEGNAPLYDVTIEGIYPKDFYGPNGLRHYANDDTFSYSIIRQAYKRPNVGVIIYRAVPKGVKEIARGDWVTLRRDYAVEHGEASLGGKGKYTILKKRVHARDLFTSGDSIDEWGYDPQVADPIEIRKAQARSSLKMIDRAARGEQIAGYNKYPGDPYYGKDVAHFEQRRKEHAEKYKDLDYQIESTGSEYIPGLLLEAAFQAHEIDLDKTYDIFKSSYEKQTGKAWEKEKFLSRIKGWTLYGDPDGFIAARQQGSGPIKLVGAAGNPVGVKKGFQELLATGKPVWGAMDLRLATMAARMGMKMPPAWVMVKILNAMKGKFAEANGLSPEALTINKDGSMTLDYKDVGKATKFVVGNKMYFDWLLKEKGDMIPAVIRSAVSFFLTTGKPPPEPEQDEQENF